MTSSRTRAIRLTIATIAASLLLSAACCVLFVLNMMGALNKEMPAEAPASKEVSVSVVWCAADAGRYETGTAI